MNVMEACRDCCFWREQQGFVQGPEGPSRTGLCHRFPPQLIVVVTPQGQQPIAHFPATLAMQGCGEFDQKVIIES